jgi:valyl-tRNA synthetase
LWDVDFRTAVAQAELEDRVQAGAYHRIRFAKAGDTGGDIEIDTTRPELIPACVALVAHPADERYQQLFGTEVLTPLFSARVPVLAHRLAEPEKGTGIAMICTFGDLTDVTWWRELSLPTRTVIQRDGRFGEAPFGEPGWESDDPERARSNYSELGGRTVKQAQRRIVEMLRESGDLSGEPRVVEHAVKFYERGERPLEIVSSRQWYVRTMSMRDRLLARGRELCWHPEFMRGRFESWVEGLTGDWNISRQRFFGVPFPIWYRVGDDGEVLEDALLPAEPERLPVDPSTDSPTGYDESQRGQPGGFVGDPDVMDTWATSSLSPQIAGGWIDDPDLFGRVFPMDLRPQAHDIIRTWLFTTIVRAELEQHQLPWRHAAISGWILDPDRKKLSKSKGNAAFVPAEPLDRHGTDAVRYWAASARLGVDTAYDEQQMKVGRRLAIKLLNVSRFVLSIGRPNESSGGVQLGSDSEAAAVRPLDAALLASLAGVVTDATDAFERFEHSRALELVETFFWSYCDDYVELVKARAYGEAGQNGAASAQRTLTVSLGVLQRCFAPFVPYCTEEVWSWWQEGSVHLARWPIASELTDAAGDGALPQLLDLTSAALGAIRRRKSEASQSVRAPVARCTLTAPEATLEVLELSRDDVMRAGAVAELELVPRHSPGASDSPAGGDAIEVELEWPAEA